MTAEQRELKELRIRIQDAEMELDILKNALESSAEHRNEIQIHEVKSLYISDEEDVPDFTSSYERILRVV